MAACYDGAATNKALCLSQQTKPTVLGPLSSLLEQAEYSRFSLDDGVAVCYDGAEANEALCSSQGQSRPRTGGLV